jgi:hypothetical protein
MSDQLVGIGLDESIAFRRVKPHVYKALLDSGNDVAGSHKYSRVKRYESAQARCKRLKRSLIFEREELAVRIIDPSLRS